MWHESHLEFDADGNVVGAPSPGTVAQLRSPEQKLTLDTSGSGPVLIVSTSPSVAAGLPLDPAEADRGALVAFLGQVPIRCRGPIRCGDQLVPSGSHDGTAVALTPTTTGVPDVDALGVAMEDSPPPVKPKKRTGSTADSAELGEASGLLNEEGGKEHTVLCFVRWNHAVRRELRDEIDKVAAQMHGTALSVLVYLTAFVAAGLVALHSTLLVVLAADNTGRDEANTLDRHAKRLRSWIFFLGLVALVLLVSIFIIFTTAVPYRRILAGSCASCLTLLFASFGLDRKSRLYVALTFCLVVLSLCYHALLCCIALKLRREQTKPRSLVSCTPSLVRWTRRLLPVCCILGVFACVFAT